MGSPYELIHVVTAKQSPMCYRGKTYTTGQSVSMKEEDYWVCQETQPEADDEKAKCFPAYCAGDDGYTTESKIVYVDVPPDETVVVPVLTIEGCARPNMVCFHGCGACLYVGYNADPLTDPTDPVVMAGGGADPNPTCRDLVENGVCVETIHMNHNGDTVERIAMSYHC